MENHGNKKYDVLIIGGGPAGLSAALYAGRAEMKTLLIEQGLPGGQAATTDAIANYPGFTEIDGPELMRRMEEHARVFGVEIITAEVSSLVLSGRDRTVVTSEGEFTAPAVIIASGAKPRKLGIPGEAEYTGAGVSYCATCDGAFYRDLHVVVVGGGDAAIQEAVFLTRFARQVTVVHRRDELRATKVVQEKAFQNRKIVFRWNTVLESIRGGDMVEAVVARNVKDNTVEDIPCDGVFMYVGMDPNTAWLPPEIKLSNQGYIITDENMLTSAPGVFAAGDVRVKLLRQIVTAVGDGATAAVAAEKYLEYLE